MFKKILIKLLLIFSFFIGISNTYAERNCLSLGSSDYGTFKEYCYKITDSFLDLRNKYEVNHFIDKYNAAQILKYSKIGLSYLPDSLANKNYYNHLKTSIEKGIKYYDDPTIFSDIEKSIDNYLNKTQIQEVTGNINVYPESGNAPLTVTLRGDVRDPSGSKLENYNYTWWIDNKGTKKVIGNKVFMTYTFLEEGNYSVFLDVTSNHRNSEGHTDVLTFSKKVDIEVKEKIASTIIRINSKSLGSDSEIKFSPKEASYGLLIDATSSTPTSGTKFVKTEWDFGNGVEIKYNGPPKVERATYASNGTYEVILRMKTNTGKIVERKFYIVIRNPIATIKANKGEGFLGDKFKFSVNPSYKDDNLTYAWEIMDLTNDKVIFKGIDSNFNYSFSNKGRYNVKLEVTAPSGEKDYDNKIIYINSRAPIADFVSSTPNSNKPNTIFLDGSKSYDLDFSDDGKLEFNWIIDGDRVKLDNPNKDGSNGYYTFSSIGDHTVILEVIDPDDISSQKKKKVQIKSLLYLDFHIFPRVSQVGSFVKFVADSPNAKFFEWKFGDGEEDGGNKNTMTHGYKESGIYDVTLKVGDKDDNQNKFTKKLYVSDANTPYAVISLDNASKKDYKYEEDACDGKGAYIVDRIGNISFSASDSIDVTGENQGLTYSWKIRDSFYSTQKFTKRFDELGCFKVKLTVRSKKANTRSTAETFIKVQNIKPSLSSLDIQVENPDSDPIVVNVKAVGAKDKDGIIQSYLWYYYTDTTNEPQDFRITKGDSTNFVLPKVNGNFYFVVILKDNNEDRVSSEDISSRYFITLSGDNINTPIVKLKVDNSSISTGNEVTFVANAENILTQNINKDSRFYWDFDGDGFYDRETKSNTVTHKYTKPGEKRAKLKVSHKGYSNTRTVTINVSNTLRPDFNYTSIGNKFIFFNETSGSVSKYYWDMGDGTILNKDKSFIYEYKDSKTSHIVKLKVEDGVKTKETSKKVVKNLSNFIDSRKNKLNLFSNFKILNNKIELDNSERELLIYIETNLDNVENYAVDYDIETDSDLNGGNDDDKDNKNEQSFYSNSPIKIKLNNEKEQTFKIYLISKKEEILASKDIKIIKRYIEDSVIDPDSITFEGVPENIKEKFQRLIEKVSLFPKEHRLKGFEYVRRLKESWGDKREKTSIIIEFEGFIDNAGINGRESLINLLESLIIEESGKPSEFEALKNLIPQKITCDSQTSKQIKEGENCYSLLVSKLDAIFVNKNLEENKVLGKEILSVIEKYDGEEMSIKDKKNFKAILITFIYDGLSNVPDEEVEKVVSEGGKDKKTSGFISFLLWVFNALLIVFLVVLIIVGIFYLFYKLKNKDQNKSFVDFVSDITSMKKKDNIYKEEIDKGEKFEFDPLENFSGDKNEEVNKQKVEIKEIEENKGENIEIKDKQLLEGSGVPSWLKSGLDNNDIKTEFKPKQELKVDKEKKEEKIEEKKEEKNVEEVKEEEKKLGTKQELDEITKITFDEDDGSVPDWLKGSLEETKPKQELKVDKEKKEEKIEEKKEEKNVEEVKEEEKKLDTKQELDEITKITFDEDDDSIPDWLKGSLEETKPKQELKADKEKKEEKIEEKKEENKKENLGKNVKEKVISKKKNIKELDKDKYKKIDANKKTNKKPLIKTKKTLKKSEGEKFSTFDFDTNKKKETNKKEESKKSDKSGENELWDDGMKVPDWLKSDDQ